MQKPDDELIDWIDEHDRVLGQVTRARMRKENLWHRVAAVLCLDGRGGLYLHQRTSTKDVFPSMYDAMIAGVVGAGESYAQAAERELREELGLEGSTLVSLFKHRFENAESKSLTLVFKTVTRGPFRHQASEIAWGAFRPIAEVLLNQDGLPFVPDGWEILLRCAAEGHLGCSPPA